MNASHRISAVAGVAALAVLSIGCASTQTADTQISDTVITTKIEAKLAGDPEINPFNVDVDTNEGVVTLSGEVEKVTARAEAERHAWNTEGVVDVDNDITYGSRSIGERVDDAWITSKVKTKIAADPELNPFNINVDTENGVVVLTGRVKTESDAAEATELARNTKGVTGVDNRLEIG